MIRKDLPKCPFCGGYANAWEWSGGARIDCENWGHDDNGTHFVGIGAKTMKETEELWCSRYGESEDFERLLMKHYEQGRIDERASANGGLMQAFNPD